MVLELGSFTSWEDVEACGLDAVIAGWLGALLQSAGGRGSGGGGGSSSGFHSSHHGSGGVAVSSEATAVAGRPRRVRAEQPPEAVWAALKTVLQRMRVGKQKRELREGESMLKPLHGRGNARTGNQ